MISAIKEKNDIMKKNTEERTIYSLCPKCTNNIPQMSFDDNQNISITCRCGFKGNFDLLSYNTNYSKSPKPVSPYVYQCEKHNLYYKFYCEDCYTHLCEKCLKEHEKEHYDYDPELNWKLDIENKENISELRNKLKKCYEHLNQYFSSIKNKAITNFPDIKSTILSSYQNSYNSNKAILDFYQIIFDNYVEHNFYMTNFFSEYVYLNVYPYIDGNNMLNVCNYFDCYSFYRTKDTKVIIHDESIFDSLLLLQDKRIAATLQDDLSIMIFDPANDYHIDIQINDNRDFGANSVCQLDNGHLVTLSYHGRYIKVWSITKSTYKCEYEIQNAHSDEVNKIVTLPNNRVASCSQDKFIKIWDMSYPYPQNKKKVKAIKVLHGHKSFVKSLLYIKERDFLISGAFDDDFRIWNATTYQCVSVIGKICASSANSMIMIDEQRIVVGGYHEMCFINIDTATVEERVGIKQRSDGKQSGFSSFLKLRDGNTIICGCNYGEFVYYNMKTKEYTEFTSAHDSDIRDILKIDEESFYTCSADLTIRLWKY